MSRIDLPSDAVVAMYRKWTTSGPDLNQQRSSRWPEILNFYADQGWDVQYWKGAYSVPAEQLYFFILSL